MSLASASGMVLRENLTPSKALKRKIDEDCRSDEQKKRKASPAPITQPLASHTGTRCDSAFFDCSCEELARSLLGCALFRKTEDHLCWGRIVETEAYLGGEDKAAHSYDGKRTQRNEAMYMSPGTAYVYSVYGIHHCFNISSKGSGAAVLVRALEPLGGVESMKRRRKCAKKERDICSGPAKLCQALNIDKACDKLDLVSSAILWVERQQGAVPWVDVVESGRVGVQYAGTEWADKPLRFYFRDCPHVSKR